MMKDRQVLAGDFNEMADKLKEMLREVEREEVQQVNGYDPNFLTFAAKQTKRRKKKK